VIGLWLPQVMGAGYDYIDQAMHDQFTWRILALLAIFKIISTSISFVSGAPGGMFAPTLFAGAMLGGVVCGVERHFYPWLPASVGAYALVGMGTLFAGFLRVPLTSVFMVLEVSGNYSIILPVMISNTIAYLISRQYQKTSLFDMLSRQDGIDLPSMEERREGVSLHVEDAMRTYQGPILHADESLGAALAKAKVSPEAFLLVQGDSGRWCEISQEELHREATQLPESESLRTVLPRPLLPHVHPDQELEEALRRLGGSPFVPVLNRADYRQLEGVLGLHEILAAYRAADR